MKRLREHLTEQVLPTAFIRDGSFDLDKQAVRDNINVILKGICARNFVTPYIALNQISKVLAQFSIILPKRSYLEGDRGMEVYELRQFGQTIGMNDKGEFINQTPTQYYLVMDYTNWSGEYTFRAEVVDKIGLDKKLDGAESMVREEKEPFKGGHKRTHDSGMEHAHRLAYKAMERMKRKNKKDKEEKSDFDPRRMLSHHNRKKAQVSEEQLDELSRDTLGSYVSKASVKNSMRRKHLSGKRQLPLDYEKMEKDHDKHEKGISKAWKKMDEEQIDEISDNLVYRHTKKVMKELPKKNAKMHYGAPKEREKAREWMTKRDRGGRLKINRLIRHMKEGLGARFAKRMYDGDAPPKGMEKDRKDNSPAMQKALDRISTAYSPKNVKKMMDDKKSLQVDRKKGLNEGGHALRNELSRAGYKKDKEGNYSHKEYGKVTVKKMSRQGRSPQDVRIKGKKIDHYVNRSLGVKLKEDRLDELSRDTLKSYQKKSNAQYKKLIKGIPSPSRDEIRSTIDPRKSNSANERAANKLADKYRWTERHPNRLKANKRKAGYQAASERLNKSGNKKFYRLDELSKGLLGRYIKKASDARAGAQVAADKYLDDARTKKRVSMKDVESGGRALRDIRNRRNGIIRAADKLSK